MDRIFSLEEEGLPRFRVEVSNLRPTLFFETVMQRGEYACRALDRDNVLSLIEALSEWAYPTRTLEAPNQSLIEQMIERAVRDQVTAVLPLHLSPVATCRASECDSAKHLSSAATVVIGCECGHPANFHSSENGCVHWYAGDQEFCQCTRGLGDLESDRFPENDPEPHDVGHPTYEDARPHPDLPVRSPRCTGCGHSWGDHTAGVCWGESCDCTEERPGTASPVPLRGPTGKILFEPLCSKCGEPWSARHGLYDNPCTPAPVAAPKQLAGCSECGHRWGIHPPAFGVDYCVAGLGGVLCGCKRTRPAGTSDAPCTCMHDRQVHGPNGCGYLGECACKWQGVAP